MNSKKEALKKVVGGKTVKIELIVDDNTIKEVIISGDFFAFPIEKFEELEEKIIRLYEGYAELLSLNIPYHPELVLGSQNIAVGTFNRGIIETIGYTHVFRTRREVKRVELRPPQVPSPTIGYLERELGSAWVEDQTI